MSTFTQTELDAITRTLSVDQRKVFDSQYNAARKNRSTAILLSIIPIIGHLGVGRFYLGQTGLGFLHVALCALFVLPGFVYWVADWFFVGKACDNLNREKAMQIAAQAKALTNL